MEERNTGAELQKTICHIPEEILEYIFALLSPYRDFKPVMLVCRRWHKIMTGVVHQVYDGFHRALPEGNTQWDYFVPHPGPSITERYSHSAVYHGKAMYVFGGCTSTSTTFNDLWRFDLVSEQWIRPLATGVYPSPKACATLVAYKDYLILFGGWSHPTPYPLHQAAKFFNQLHIYSTKENQWSYIYTPASLPGKAGHSASVVGNVMLVFGGSHGHGISCDEVWELDLDEKTWCYKEIDDPKPLPRYGHSQVTLDDYHVLIIGGCGGPNMQFNDIWLLEMKGSKWRWFEMVIGNSDNSAPQLWCHSACKVGDKVVVLSKNSRSRSSTPTTPPHKPQKPGSPRDSMAARAHNSEQTDQDTAGHNPTTSPDVREHCQVNKQAHSSKRLFMKRPPPDTSESSSQESSSDTEEAASPASRHGCHSSGKNRLGSIAKSAASRPSSLPAAQSVACPSGTQTSSLRTGMPSIRLNAMKNRQRQLETLKKYEDKIRGQMAKMSASSDAKESGRQTMSLARNAQNPMYVHLLDVSEAVTKHCVTWLPVAENADRDSPDETIFYSLVEGRGHLIMFGGIQTDLNSMQRGLNVNTQVVKSSVHFISAKRVLR